MSAVSLEIVDLIIVAIFFIVTFLIGIIDRKKVRIEDYWVNSRKTNKFALVASVVSTYMGAVAILALAGVTYSGAGLAAFSIVGSIFFYFFIFAKFFAPRIKEFGDKFHAYTLPDFLEFRYSKNVRIVGALVILVSYSLWLALQMLGVAAFVSAIIGFNPVIATIIGGFIVIAYTAIGGLRADIRTDIFQFFIMLSLLIVFLPMLIVKGGGLDAISTLPTSFLIGTEFAPLYVFIFAFFFLGASTLTSAELWQRSYAGDTKKNVRWAMGISSILIVLFLAMSVLFGIYGRLLLPNANPNLIVPELLSLILPAGIFGIVLAGFFAAIMSTADSILLVTSMTLVHDLYQKTFDKKLSPENLLKMSRWVTFIVGMLALSVALVVFNLVHLAIESLSFYVVLLPAIVFGFYWKKATSNAAFWSIIFGFITIVAFVFIDPVQAFIPGIIVGFLTFLIVNAFTKRKQSVIQ